MVNVFGLYPISRISHMNVSHLWVTVGSLNFVGHLYAPILLAFFVVVVVFRRRQTFLLVFSCIFSYSKFLIFQARKTVSSPFYALSIAYNALDEVEPVSYIETGKKPLKEMWPICFELNEGQTMWSSREKK